MQKLCVASISLADDLILAIGNMSSQEVQAAIDGNLVGKFAAHCNQKADVNCMGWKWIGDCTNSFDEDGDCLIGIFSDVSDFAVIEERASKVAINGDDLVMPEHVPFGLAFTTDRDRGVLFGYDVKSDVHHFFVPAMV